MLKINCFYGTLNVDEYNILRPNEIHYDCQPHCSPRALHLIQINKGSLPTRAYRFTKTKCRY